MPGSAHSLLDERLERQRAVERQRAAGDGAGERGDGDAARARHADALGDGVAAGVGERARRREHVRRARRRARHRGVARQRLAPRGDQFAGELRRARHRHLLAQDGADRQFEAVPATGHAPARTGAHRRAQRRVARQRLADGDRIGGDVEQAANALDRVAQPARRRHAQGRLQRARRPRARSRCRRRRRASIDGVAPLPAIDSTPGMARCAEELDERLPTRTARARQRQRQRRVVAASPRARARSSVGVRRTRAASPR